MSVLCRQRITWMQNHISLTDRVTPHFWSHSLLYTLLTFDLDVTWPPPTTWCILIILFWNNACLLRIWKICFYTYGNLLLLYRAMYIHIEDITWSNVWYRYFFSIIYRSFISFCTSIEAPEMSVFTKFKIELNQVTTCCCPQ